MAVATGHGREATGIDINYVNAGLALDRIGPLFLDITWPDGDLTLPALGPADTTPGAYDAWLTDEQAALALDSVVDWWETSWPPTPAPTAPPPRPARRRAPADAGQLDLLAEPT